MFMGGDTVHDKLSPSGQQRIISFSWVWCDRFICRLWLGSAIKKDVGIGLPHTKIVRHATVS